MGCRSEIALSLGKAMTLTSLHNSGTGKGKNTEAGSEWVIPEFFTNPGDEFRAAVAGAAIFDSTSFGRIEVSGSDRLDLLHRLSTNDLLGLRPSQVSGTIFTTDRGRIVDLVFVAVLDSTLLMIVSPGNEDRIIRWIQTYTVLEDITLRKVTDETAMFSIVGNGSLEALSAIGGTVAGANRCGTGEFAGRSLLALGIQARRWQGVHVVGSRPSILGARLELTGRGEGRGLVPLGSRAYELYRIAAGVPALERELSESFNPYDVGLLEFVNFKKGCYIGQEVIARLDTYKKAARDLSGLIFDQAPGEGANGTPIVKEGKVIGQVTSVATEAIEGRYIGLGVVRTEEVQHGAMVQVAGRTAILRNLPMFPPYS